MVIFKENDFFLGEIARESGFDGMVTKYFYRVFGLKNQKNPPIQIVYNPDMHSYDSTEVFLHKFFADNNIHVQFNVKNGNNVWIGLRKDVRENKKLAISLLKTIVFYLEGRLELNNGSKITGAPVLEFNN